ncbi:MAG: T9SS type A sorting domain-containing protein [Bacteroidales bacterium]|jgi:hypothetical protein|nr:T9SS type A sorting domain-containing protein [Bacteroidales bacterium]
MKKIIFLSICAILLMCAGFAAHPQPNIIYNGEDVNPAWYGLASTVSNNVTNPVKDGINTSDHCVSIVRQCNTEDDNGGRTWSGGALWEGSSVDIDVEKYNCFSLMVLKESAGHVVLELQADGTDNTQISVEYTTPGEWQKLTFSMKCREQHIQRILVLIHDEATFTPASQTMYWDNLVVFYDSNSQNEELLYDGETVNPAWGGLAADVMQGANPQKSGINTSDNCVYIYRDATDTDPNGRPWSGGGLWGCDKVYIDPADYTSVSLMVLKGSATGKVTIEVQDADETVKDYLHAQYTTPGEWQELFFSIPQGRTLMMNRFLVEIHDEAAGSFTSQNMYWDNLKVHKGSLSPITPINAEFYQNQSQPTTYKVAIKGSALAAEITVSKDGTDANFVSFSPATLNPAKVNSADGDTLTITIDATVAKTSAAAIIKFSGNDFKGISDETLDINWVTQAVSDKTIAELRGEDPNAGLLYRVRGGIVSYVDVSVGVPKVYAQNNDGGIALTNVGSSYAAGDSLGEILGTLIAEEVLSLSALSVPTIIAGSRPLTVITATYNDITSSPAVYASRLVSLDTVDFVNYPTIDKMSVIQPIKKGSETGISVKPFNATLFEAIDVPRHANITGIVSSIVGSPKNISLRSPSDLLPVTIASDAEFAVTPSVAQNLAAAPSSSDTVTFTINGSCLTDDIEVTLTGTDSDKFYIIDGLTAIVPQSGVVNNALVKVVYAPDVEGTHTATVMFSSLNVEDTVKIPLTGFSDLTLIPASTEYNLGTLTVGETKNLAIPVTGANLGGDITVDTAAGTGHIDFSFGPSILTQAKLEAGGDTIFVSVTPTLPNSEQTVTLSLTGGGLVGSIDIDVKWTPVPQVPVLYSITPVANVSLYQNQSEEAKYKVAVKGKYLTENLAVASNDLLVSFSPSTLDYTKVNSDNGDTLTVTINTSSAQVGARAVITFGSDDFGGSSDTTLIVEWTTVAVADKTLAELRSENPSDGLLYRVQGGTVSYADYAIPSLPVIYIQDNNGGIALRGTSLSGYNAGDSVGDMLGHLAAADGSTYNVLSFLPLSAPSIKATGKSLAPIVATYSDIKNNTSVYASRLVRLDTVDFVNYPTATRLNVVQPIKKGEETGIGIKVFSPSLFSSIAVPPHANITGVVSNATSTKQISPRTVEEIVPFALYTDSSALTVLPAVEQNPFAVAGYTDTLQFAVSGHHLISPVQVSLTGEGFSIIGGVTELEPVAGIVNTVVKVVFAPTSVADYPATISFSNAHTSTVTVVINGAGIKSGVLYDGEFVVPVWTDVAAPNLLTNGVANPNKTGINTSDHCISVVRNDSSYHDNGGRHWTGGFISVGGGGVSSSEYNRISLMVLKNVAGPVRFELQDGEDLFTEQYTTVGEWQKLTFKIDCRIRPIQRFLVAIHVVDTNFAEPQLMYWDNLEVFFEPNYPENDTMLVYDGEAVNPEWTSIASTLDLNYDNPLKTGINPSDKCVSMIRESADVDPNGREYSGGVIWQCNKVRVDPAQYKYISLMVLKETAGKVTIEVQSDGEENKDWLSAEYTTPNVWQELKVRIPATRTALINNILVQIHVEQAGSFNTQRMYWDNLKVYKGEPYPIIYVDPATAQYFNAQIGGARNADTVTFTVQGFDLVDDISVSIEGADYEVFSIYSANSTVSVVYAPAAVGTHQATLVFESEGAETVEIDLFGSAATVGTEPLYDTPAKIVDVRIYDVRGILVQSKYMETMPTGVYIERKIDSNGKVYTKKFIWVR